MHAYRFFRLSKLVLGDKKTDSKSILKPKQDVRILLKESQHSILKGKCVYIYIHIYIFMGMYMYMYMYIVGIY